MAKLKDIGMGKGRGSEITQEQEQAKVFEMLSHDEGWWHAVKTNPKALLWCSYSLFSCIMWGYDGLASSIVLAVLKFREDYGVYAYVKDKKVYDWVIPAIWQLALGAGSLIGLLLGGIGAGFIAKKYGRQLCMALSYVFTIIGVFLQWFSAASTGHPGDLPMLFGGKVLTGIPLGVFITIAPTYCSEIAPLPLRGATTAAVNWSIVLGQCLAYVVIRQTQGLENANAYRILFAVQWIFAAIGLGVLFFFPESPYFLVAQGRIEKAKNNARRLYNKNFDVDGLISSIELLLKHEAEDQKSASYRECFRGTNTLRTLIAMSTFFIQSICGIGWIIGYMAYFLQLGGLGVGAAFTVTMILSFIMLIGNMVGWVFVERFGRRGTALYGSVTLSVSLLAIGITGCFKSSNAIWVQVVFMAIWSFTYQSTIGSVAWPIVTEVSKSTLRGHTQSLATITTGIVGAVSGVCLPFLVNPDQGNMGGKVGFIYGTLLGLSCIGVWWYYPETKGRTFAEIDRLFEMGIRPRDFEKTRLDG
ncbi:putative sugar transporter [Hyaloscypha bicolor E]|uniref:Putative sugar transporter n=1 Tax=Hyaloscypha bicolor E TaxID=1095630 RepID=A0A2J6SJM2_9HELO|nr:putative sugar transporter [Hyaloscypha bicolor E]PMD50968.1 putative sugar transporter [Hyaloscypha bicolor E]